MGEDMKSALSTREKAAVELGLPAHLLWLSADRVSKEGWLLRADVFEHLSKAAAAALAGMFEHEIVRCAKAIDETATAVLRELSFDDPRDGLIGCAMLTQKLVDEFLYLDVRNQAVLVSLLLIDDAKDAGSDMPFNEAVLQRNVGRMLRRLRLLGFYSRFATASTTG